MSDEPAQDRREVYYSGRVQGVGFRYTTRWIATRYQVTGFVKNLSDGRVHLVAEGSADQVEGLLREIDDTMGRYVHNIQETRSPASGQFATFEIRF